MTPSGRPGSLVEGALQDLASGSHRRLRLLFVCTGNTCRSPMAESIGRAVWGADPQGPELRSAGLAATEGAPASTPARQVVTSHGGDLEAHRSHQITAEDLEWADLVLTMTRSHRQALRGLRQEGVRILTLAEFGGAEDVDVADPYGGTPHDYEAAYGQIESYIREGATALQTRPDRDVADGPI